MAANETLLDFKHGNFGDPGLKNLIVPTHWICLASYHSLSVAAHPTSQR